MKFLIGLPTTDGKYDIEIIRSIINQFPYIIDGHHSVQNVTVKGTMIHNARNSIAKAAVEGEYDYLFFIDSDCVIPNDTLRKLVSHDKDIVSGLYFQKTPPFLPVMYTQNKKGLFDHIIDYPKGLIEAEGIGMGVCLIKTDVLKKLGENPFNPYQKDKKSPFINAEDLAFCIRARAKGYKVFVDTEIQALHQTTRYIDEDYHKKAMEKMYKENPKWKKK